MCNFFFTTFPLIILSILLHSCSTREETIKSDREIEFSKVNSFLNENIKWYTNDLQKEMVDRLEQKNRKPYSVDRHLLPSIECSVYEVRSNLCEYCTRVLVLEDNSSGKMTLLPCSNYQEELKVPSRVWENPYEYLLSFRNKDFYGLELFLNSSKYIENQGIDYGAIDSIFFLHFGNRYTVSFDTILQQLDSISDLEKTKSVYLQRRLKEHLLYTKVFESKESVVLFKQNFSYLYNFLVSLYTVDNNNGYVYSRKHEYQKVEKGNTRLYFDGYHYHLLWITEIQSKHFKKNKYRVDYYIL